MQLIEEMKEHQKKHFRLLERVKMTSSSGNLSLSRQNSLAPEVKKIWSTTIKKFEKGEASYLHEECSSSYSSSQTLKSRSAF